MKGQPLAIRFKVAKGRHLFGEKCPWAKLSTADVATIRASDEPQSALAQRFGVSQSTICRARTGQRRKDG